MAIFGDHGDDFDDNVRVNCILKAETTKAVLVEVDGEDHWLPSSMVGDTDLIDVGDTGYVEIPAWLAEERGIYT